MHIADTSCSSSSSFLQAAQLVQRRELICVPVLTLVYVTLYTLIYAAVYTQFYVSVCTLVYVIAYTMVAMGALRRLIARNEVSQTAVQIFVR